MHYGTLQDDISLALLYAATDVFVAPSTQDNFPEYCFRSDGMWYSFVAFNIGGMPDMIEHRSNGYLAHPFDSNDLAQGIKWILQDVNQWQNLSHMARNKVEQEYTSEIQSKRYLELYTDILNNTNCNYQHRE